MTTLSRKSFLDAMMAVPLVARRDDWAPLFYGKSLDRWRPGVNTGTWPVGDGGLEGDPLPETRDGQPGAAGVVGRRGMSCGGEKPVVGAVRIIEEECHHIRAGLQRREQ